MTNFLKSTSIALLLLLMLAACNSSAPAVSSSEAQSSEPPVQIVNPLKDVLTVAELNAQMVFDLSTPVYLPVGYKQTALANIADTTAEIVYSKDEDKITYRQSSEQGDISGDYNSYAEQSEQQISFYTVQLFGNDNKISKAIWDFGGTRYSITSSTPFEKDDFTAIITSVSPLACSPEG